MGIEIYIDLVLVIFLAVTGIAIIYLRNLFAVAMLSGIYSLLMASIFVVLDAVDVAFTEASVGAGISTVLMLGVLSITGNKEKISHQSSILPLLIVIATGALLIYGTWDLPLFGDPNAPIHVHVAPEYISNTYKHTGMPNIVTAVLASYRGYDTLGEVGVIFTAGIGVLLLLSKSRIRNISTKEKTSSRDKSERKV